MNQFLGAIVFCFSIVSVGRTQLSFSSYKNPSFQQFFNTTTYVELSGRAELDEKIKKTLGEHWRFTNIKYALRDSLPTLLESTESKLSVEVITVIRSQKGKPDRAEYFTNLCLRISKKKTSKKMTEIIASVPLFCNQTGEGKAKECSLIDVAFKIDRLLLQIIETVNFVKNENVKSSVVTYSGKFVKKFNESAVLKHDLIVNRKLIVCETFFSLRFSRDDFESVYKYPFIIVEQAKYKQACDSKDLVLFAGYDLKNAFVFSIYDMDANKTLFVDVGKGKNKALMSQKQVKKWNIQYEKLVDQVVE
jgi:hypothetical protein